MQKCKSAKVQKCKSAKAGGEWCVAGGKWCGAVGKWCVAGGKWCVVVLLQLIATSCKTTKQLYILFSFVGVFLLAVQNSSKGDPPIG